MVSKILISACLLGRPVRYDGKGKPLLHPAVERWKMESRLVGFCPEQAGGLPTPRPPAEIESGMTGEDVLAGRARVLEVTGGDVTAEFVTGGERAVAFARAHDCRFALLVDGSPSCGSGFIYDGSFSGQRHPGFGVTAALMRAAGIAVYSDREVDELAALLEP
ncbi:MAG: purine-nucleoside phosphorylase [Rhizobium sp.]|nr:MAG: purine-nucleoside phosphorylase [Rhizobium sp.]